MSGNEKNDNPSSYSAPRQKNSLPLKRISHVFPDQQGCWTITLTGSKYSNEADRNNLITVIICLLLAVKSSQMVKKVTQYKGKCQNIIQESTGTLMKKLLCVLLN